MPSHAIRPCSRIRTLGVIPSAPHTFGHARVFSRVIGYCGRKWAGDLAVGQPGPLRPIFVGRVGGCGWRWNGCSGPTSPETYGPSGSCGRETPYSRATSDWLRPSMTTAVMTRRAFDTRRQSDAQPIPMSCDTLFVCPGTRHCRGHSSDSAAAGAEFYAAPTRRMAAAGARRGAGGLEPAINRLPTHRVWIGPLVSHLLLCHQVIGLPTTPAETGQYRSIPGRKRQINDNGFTCDGVPVP